MNEEVEISNQQKSVKNMGLWDNEVWAKSDFMHFSVKVKGGLITEGVLCTLDPQINKLFFRGVMKLLMKRQNYSLRSLVL